MRVTVRSANRNRLCRWMRNRWSGCCAGYRHRRNWPRWWVSWPAGPRAPIHILRGGACRTGPEVPVQAGSRAPGARPGSLVSPVDQARPATRSRAVAVIMSAVHRLAEGVETTGRDRLVSRWIRASTFVHGFCWMAGRSAGDSGGGSRAGMAARLRLHGLR
jgi:hypothetical protein